jgi:hypothetical protein
MSSLIFRIDLRFHVGGFQAGSQRLRERENDFKKINEDLADASGPPMKAQNSFPTPR